MLMNKSEENTAPIQWHQYILVGRLKGREHPLFIVCLINNTYLIGRLKGREHPLYSSNALIYDAVQVLSKALNDLASMEVITEKMVNATYSW